MKELFWILIQFSCRLRFFHLREKGCREEKGYVGLGVFFLAHLRGSRVFCFNCLYLPNPRHFDSIKNLYFNQSGAVL